MCCAESVPRHRRIAEGGEKTEAAAKKEGPLRGPVLVQAERDVVAIIVGCGSLGLRSGCLILGRLLCALSTDEIELVDDPGDAMVGLSILLVVVILRSCDDSDLCALDEEGNKSLLCAEINAVEEDGLILVLVSDFLLPIAGEGETDD